jgi:hypothetical protein
MELVLGVANLKLDSPRSIFVTYKLKESRVEHLNRNLTNIRISTELIILVDRVHFV